MEAEELPHEAHEGDSLDTRYSRRLWLIVSLLAGSTIVVTVVARRRRARRRDATDDTGLALVELAAGVADVLAEYQEAIADEAYLVSTDSSGRTTVTFGDGATGSRPAAGESARDEYEWGVGDRCHERTR